jgi:flavin-dependent dehydrogenase
VGAGPAAAPAGLALCREGIEVVLLDPGRSRARIGESVPPPVGGTLARLGLDPELGASGHLESLGTASSWGSSHIGYRDYFVDGRGPGWHLDREILDSALIRAAMSAGSAILHGRLVGDRRTGGSWEIAWRDDSAHTHSLSAEVVIDASGRRAAFASRVGARRHAVDRLVGLVATVPDRRPAPARHTMIEAVSRGWWYTSPLPGGRRTVVLLSDKDLLDPLRQTGAAGWRAAFTATRHLGAEVGPLSAEVSLSVRSARSQVLQPSIGQSWLAIGDASCAVDPISGSGVFRALEDALVAARLTGSGALDDPGARQAHDRRIQEEFQRYLAVMRAVYARETRWSTPSWVRRRA